MIPTWRERFDRATKDYFNSENEVHPPTEVWAMQAEIDDLRAALATARASEREWCALAADRFAEMMEQGAGELSPGGRFRQLARDIRSGAALKDAP